MATYRVTSPEGVTYRVEGPDGASEEEVLSQIDAYKQGASAPEAAPTVKPGDVAARKAQVEAQAAAEKPNTVRERLTGPGILGKVTGVANEFFSGIGDTARNLGNIASPSAYTGFDAGSGSAGDVLKGAGRMLIDNPIAGTALGVARSVAAPMAPLADEAAKLGENVSGAAQKAGFTTLADLLGAGSMAAADVLAPMAGARYLKNVRGLVQSDPRTANLLKSKRAQATELKGALSEAEQGSAKRMAEIQSDLATNKEGIQQLKETAEEMVPTKAELQAKFAPQAPLGKTAGKDWQTEFSNKWNASKERFNKEYGEITNAGAGREVVPESYVAAGGDIRAAKGVTGKPTIGPAEGVAEKLKRTMNLDEFENDTYKSLRDQLDAAPAADKSRVQGVIDEFKKDHKMPEMPDVRDLILERQRLKAGQRAVRGDWAKKQFDPLIKGLEDDIARVDEPLAQRLFAADKAYATEHAPYFTQGTITRAIGTGKPEAVVDAIYRPTISAGGKTGSNTKALEAMQRAREVIDDPAQWEKINKAFINKGIEFASDGSNLDPKKLVQWWKSYKDPAGTANEVLRKGLGEQAFKEIDSVFSQLDKAPQKTIDSIAKDLVKGFEGRAKEATAAEAAHIKATGDALRKQIADLSGTPVGKITDKLQSIGAGVFTSGTVGGDSARALKGGYIMMGARGVAKLLETTRGRSLFKAVLRSSPDHAHRAAVARQVVNLVGKDEED